MMIRCSASAASTAVIDFSRETESGRMMKGKTTTSFKGSTGRMSGIGSSWSRSAAISFSFSSVSAMFPKFRSVFFSLRFAFRIQKPGPSFPVLLLGAHRDLVFAFSLVRHLGKKDLEQPVLQDGAGLVRIHGPRKRDRFHEPAEVSLHAEESDPSA